jgi:NifU-like protein involved in Fe-S cluster formation
MHCSVLAEEALKSAIDDYLNKSSQEVKGGAKNV